MTQITQEETARRQRAQRYESLQGEAAGLRERVENVARQLIDVKPLRKIAALVDDVPTAVVTRFPLNAGGMGLPSGVNARDLLKATVLGAIDDVLIKNGKKQRALDADRERLKIVEKELEELA